MAGRPPLAIGSYGKIRTNDVTKPGGPKTIRAYTQYRDPDGRTRQVSATGASRAAAERELKARLAARSASTADDITGDTRFKVAAERWHQTIVAAVEAGDRSPSTAAAYRGLLDKHVLSAVGELRLREATTGRLDAVLTAIKAKSGSPTVKSCRTVISGVLGWAARQDAVTTNATRNTSAIPTKPRKQPRALTVEECARWLERLAADEQAIRHDLVDLTGFELATGVRIGEVLGVAWDDVDLVGRDMVVDGVIRRTCAVRIDWTVCRVKGRPLFRKRVKTAAGERTLRLPQFAVTMLRRRAVELYVLQTGYLPAVSAASGQLCGGSGELCAILWRSTSEGGPAGPTPFRGHSADIAEVGACACRAREAALGLGATPVFPDSKGGWRDPANTRRDIRRARGEEFSWVTSHVFRKTAATMLDEAGLTARQIANQLGHSRPSLTQDVYMGRGVVDPQAAAALERGLSNLFSMDKPSTNLRNESQDTA
jgi:integrase